MIPWRSSEDATVIPITMPCARGGEREREKERERKREGGEGEGERGRGRLTRHNTAHYVCCRCTCIFVWWSVYTCNVVFAHTWNSSLRLSDITRGSETSATGMLNMNQNAPMLNCTKFSECRTLLHMGWQSPQWCFVMTEFGIQWQCSSLWASHCSMAALYMSSSTTVKLWA